METVERTIYIYFGDNLFSKLLNFECKEHKYLLKYAKSKVFNSIISSPENKIDDVYLGWSFLIYKIGKKKKKAFNYTLFSRIK